jgi:hypothetical protein
MPASTQKPPPKTVWEKLREPFPPEQIGKLPRGGTTLDFVGHAATTQRLLEADPEYTFELVKDGTGQPILVYEPKALEQAHSVGVYGRLTIGGVTREEFGNGKNLKEAVSDALKRCAMRFGVALDLWAKEDLTGNGNAAKPFQAPASVRGNGKPDEEAVGLAAELIDLASELGRLTGQEDVVANVQTAIEKHAVDKPWLRRAITAARKNIQTAGTQT